MEKNLNIIASIAAFLVGGLFVLSDNASLTANVIGYSGGAASIMSTVGLIMIVLSMVFFMLTINLDLEKLVRHSNKMDEIKGHSLHQEESEAKEYDKEKKEKP